LFWITRRLVDIVAPLIAFGVLRMRGVAGREGWRWLFLIEGVFMLSVAIWSVLIHCQGRDLRFTGLSSKWLPLLHGPSDGSERTAGSLSEKSISSVIGLFEMILPREI
jgi:hypothetical protein